MLKSIKLNNFRNFCKYKIKDFSKYNIFLGPNASGKTNLLESIALVTSLNSFRNAKTQYLVNMNCLDEQPDSYGCYTASQCDKTSLLNTNFNSNSNYSFARIEAKHIINECCSTNQKSANDSKTENSLYSNLVMIADPPHKKYIFNGKQKSIKELKGRYPSISFTPDDLTLIKGSNRQRLTEFDNLGSQISNNYFTVLKDYNKIIKHKNKVLKNNPDIDTIKSLNDVMVIVASQLAIYRYKLVKKIAPIIANFYSYDEFNIEYISSWGSNFDISETRDKLSSTLNNNLETELVLKHCVVGPHKDKLIFNLNGQDANIFASQGQQRSIVLALKLSELQFSDEILGSKAILLLDDVMSELDKEHRSNFLELISLASQVFITTTNVEYFSEDFLQKSTVYNICATQK